jgi:hypothetical protein
VAAGLTSKIQYEGASVTAFDTADGEARPAYRRAFAAQLTINTI